MLKNFGNALRHGINCKFLFSRCTKSLRYLRLRLRLLLLKYRFLHLDYACQEAIEAGKSGSPPLCRFSRSCARWVHSSITAVHDQIRSGLAWAGKIGREEMEASSHSLLALLACSPKNTGLIVKKDERHFAVEICDPRLRSDSDWDKKRSIFYLWSPPEIVYWWYRLACVVWCYFYPLL